VDDRLFVARQLLRPPRGGLRQMNGLPRSSPNFCSSARAVWRVVLAVLFDQEAP